jgi:hypothetical protein
MKGWPRVRMCNPLAPCWLQGFANEAFSRRKSNHYVTLPRYVYIIIKPVANRFSEYPAILSSGSTQESLGIFDYLSRLVPLVLPFVMWLKSPDAELF